LWRRRLLRLCRRIDSGDRPIVWVRALPGSGKTRLLDALARPMPGRRGRRWTLLDDPTPAVLRAALDARVRPGPAVRVLVASRARGAAAELLLAPRMYGRVDLIDERDLFVTAADCRSAADRALRQATGGWPSLIDAASSGRAEEVRGLLPAFLEREVIPDLPAAVTIALFASLPAPLAATAVEHLFGTAGPPHALLEATPAGVIVAGTWVRAALARLPIARQAGGRPLLDGVMHILTRFADPTLAITALVAIDRHAQALAVFDAAGGMFFGYRQGPRALTVVLDAFGPDWERRHEPLFLARLYLLIKSGQPREALLRLEAQQPGLPVDLRRLRVSHRPYAVLMRIDLSLDLDEPPPLEVVASWGRLEAFFTPGDELARGILYNIMALGFLEAGALSQAQELADEALAVYRRAGSPYLEHFMLLHVCDLSLRHGRLRAAAEVLGAAEAALTASGLAFNSEPAILDCFRARIACEEGRFGDCPADVEPILQALLRGDSWPDLISALAVPVVFAGFWRQGLRHALGQLDHCALTLSRRHGTAQHRVLDLLRIRLYQSARRHEEARMRLEEYDLQAPPRRGSPLEAEEELVRLRQRLTGLERGRAVQLALEAAGRLAALPAFEARQFIALGVLRSHLHHRQGEPGPARRHLTAALRQAEAEGMVGVLVEFGEYLERLLPGFVDAPGPGNERLAAFARRIARLLETLPSMPSFSKALAGVTRQEHRVLALVAEGYANKQIARALASSESVVKFHLRNLFRKFRVRSRGALAEAAARRGLRT
jgi:DNA-binding CsgD family transcriptional regulator